MIENTANAVSDKISSGTRGSRGVKKSDADANKPTRQQHPHHMIDYNKDLEYLLKDNAEECESLGILHRASYEKYNRLSNYINIPVIILSSAIGFATGIDIGYEKMNIILGIGSIFVGIIKSIDTYFQLGKRSESHRLCSLQYQQIHKKIQIELALKRPLILAKMYCIQDQGRSLGLSMGMKKTAGFKIIQDVDWVTDCQLKWMHLDNN